MKKNEIKVKKKDLEKLEDLDSIYDGYQKVIENLTEELGRVNKKIWTFIHANYTLDKNYIYEYDKGIIRKLRKKQQ